MKTLSKYSFILTLMTLFIYSCQENKNKIENSLINQQKLISIQSDTIKTINESPELFYSKQSGCNESCELRSKIIQNCFTHDTLLLKLAIVLDCGVKYSIEFETANKESLNIKPINNSGVVVDCYCLYVFDLHIKNIKFKPKSILINGTPINQFSKIDNNEIVDPIGEIPTFPGGDNAYHNFINKNLKYPDSSLKQKIEGTVYFSCTIDESGKIQNYKIIRGINQEIDSEATRLISIMPNWIPVKNKTRMYLPVKFSLNNYDKKSSP